MTVLGFMLDLGKLASAVHGIQVCDFCFDIVHIFCNLIADVKFEDAELAQLWGPSCLGFAC